MMKNENGKKEWNGPVLIVLTRNNPEEAVLESCKGMPGNGFENVDGFCHTSDHVPCDQLTVS